MVTHAAVVRRHAILQADASAAHHTPFAGTATPAARDLRVRRCAASRMRAGSSYVVTSQRRQAGWCKAMLFGGSSGCVRPGQAAGMCLNVLRSWSPLPLPCASQVSCKSFACFFLSSLCFFLSRTMECWDKRKDLRGNHQSRPWLITDPLPTCYQATAGSLPSTLACVSGTTTTAMATSDATACSTRVVHSSDRPAAHGLVNGTPWQVGQYVFVWHERRGRCNMVVSGCAYAREGVAVGMSVRNKCGRGVWVLLPSLPAASP